MSPFETRSFSRSSFGKITPVEFPIAVCLSVVTLCYNRCLIEIQVVIRSAFPRTRRLCSQICLLDRRKIALNRATVVEELKEVSFVRLLPLDAIGRERSDVKAFDIRAQHKVLNPLFVPGESTHD